MVNGSAEIAAKLITPRVPAQLSAAVSWHDKGRTRPCGPLPSRVGTRWVSTSHAGRSSSTTPTVPPAVAVTTVDTR